MKLYQDIRYSQERLIGTIARVKNKAAAIIGLDATVVMYSELTSGKQTANAIQDLDVNPVPLGYMNYDETANWLCRSSVRNDWKQGLRAKTIRSLNGEVFLEGNAMKALGRCIEGDYPTYEKALKVTSERGTMMAFSRDFAVFSGLKIYYKGKYEVGQINNKEITLFDKFKWLTESLEEVYVVG